MNAKRALRADEGRLEKCVARTQEELCLPDHSEQRGGFPLLGNLQSHALTFVGLIA